MDKFNLEKLPELSRHTELKANMESAWNLLQTEQYRPAANELRQALEYIIDCYTLAVNVEEENIPQGVSLYNKIEVLKSGEWISIKQADSFHSIRKRCNAGVHRNTSHQGKQMTPADIRYSYELLVQELQDFLTIFPESLQCEEEKKIKRNILAQNWEKQLREKEAEKSIAKQGEIKSQEKEEGREEDSFSQKQREKVVEEHKYSFLEDRTGAATEEAFLEMMENLIKKTERV